MPDYTDNKDELDFSDYKTGLSFRFGVDNGATFHVVSLYIHHHSFDDEECSVRFAVGITIIGLTFEIAIMRAYAVKK